MFILNTIALTNTGHDSDGVQETLSESTIECMRQQVIRQRIKVEAER